MKLYAPLVHGLLMLMAVAVVVRVIWELLAPALIPVSLVLLAVALLVLVYRRR